MQLARRIRIHGRVQGVWYRAWTVETASSLGLVGWVRNCPDGTVEVAIQGSRSKVERFIELAYEGPTHAEVSRIDSVDCEPLSLSSFEQRPTPRGR